MGVDIVKIEYDIFDDLEATVRVKSDNDISQVRFYVKPKSFFKGGLGIKDINEYTLVNYECENSSWEEKYSEEKGMYIASLSYSTTIGLGKDYVFTYLFGIEECSIPWVIKNISTIEAQLMAIPDDRYSYYRSPRGDEVYFKRVKREQGILLRLEEDVKNNDSLFVFQNPDCNPEKPSKSE
jgi:hypothetical protein